MIRGEDLCVSYGDKRVLDGFSFLLPGEGITLPLAAALAWLLG